MDSQLALPLRESIDPPRISAEDVEWLCLLLSEAADPGWMSSGELARLAAENGLPGWNERRIRAIAEAADGAVLSWPGSPGYKLFDTATEAEAARCDAAWGSQIERMTARRTAYRRRHHGRELVKA